MNEGGANQPMPLVHNGIMYLVNTGNIVQALDAADRRADLGEPASGRSGDRLGAMRNIAIYEDKIFVATTDARLVALDARTGKLVWTTRDRRSQRRASTTRAARSSSSGKVMQGLQGCDRYREERCFISAYDAAHRQAAVEVQHHRAAPASRAATPGASCRT